MKKAQLLHQETSVTPLTLGVNHRGFHHRLHFKYTKPFYFKNSFIAYKNYRVDWYGDLENFCDLGDIVINKVKKDANFSRRLLVDTKKVGRYLTELNNKILVLNLSRQSNRQISDLLNKLYKLAEDICDLGAVAVFPDLRHYKLSTLLKEILKDRVEKLHLRRPVNDYFSLLIAPPIYGLVQAEKVAELKLAKKVSHHLNLFRKWKKLSSKKLLNYLQHFSLAIYKELINLEKKYRWSSFGQLGPAKKLEDYIIDIKRDLSNTDLSREVINADNYFFNLQRLQNKYFQELDFDVSGKRLFKAARDFSENKIYRYNVLLQTWYTLGQLLKEIARRFNFSVADLRFMSIEEIVLLLIGRRVVSKKETNNRRRYCITVIKGTTGIKHLTGKRAKFYLRHNTEVEVVREKVKTLHGSVAFVGRISGRVKIINSPKDVKKIKNGEVMISTQTNPDLLPAMKKAVAFVTDVGGITSHAAIVARELKKPCIIGTKIASKVFKDGDLADVDVIKGNVTLIKKI